MMNLGQRASRGVPGQSIQNRDYYPFKGGLNLVDPFLSIQPGQLLACMNYEPFFRGGYRRVAGYERIDGRPRPHRASYQTLIVDVVDAGAAPVAGNTIEWGPDGGATTGSATVLYMAEGNPVIEFFTGDEPEVGDEVVVQGGVRYGFVEQYLIEDTLIDEENDKALQAAQEARRAIIEPVPGSGPIRGVCLYGDRVYAVRDNAGGDAGVIWRTSAAGWEEFALNPLLRFDGGVTEIEEGQTITGATSGATATVGRLRRKQGSWALETAEGYLSLYDVTGTFTDDEDLEIDSAKVAVADGTQFTPTIPPGGRYEFRVYTFSNKWTEPRLYGVNGVGEAFEIDDENDIYTPIETGMEVDKPKHIATHNRMLFLSFQGGSIQNSSINNPMEWDVASGANEMLVGGECTGFIDEVNDALLVYTRDAVRVLYGQTSEEFNLVTLNNELGGIEYTQQRIGTTIHIDQRGFTSVAAATEYGNFIPTDLSQLIQPALKNRMGDVFGAQISRTQNLYRLFMDDGSAFILGFHGNTPAGFTIIDYGRPVTALWSSQTEGNLERLFFGSDNGMVYEQDVGTSFDGGAIEAFVLMVFYHSGNPEQNKRYRKAVLEMSGFQATISGSVDVNYGGTGESAIPREIGVSAGGNFWDVGEWSEFIWSEGVGADPSFYIEDTGFNIGLHLYHNSSRESPHILHGINITWSPRRLKREF